MQLFGFILLAEFLVLCYGEDQSDLQTTLKSKCIEDINGGISYVSCFNITEIPLNLPNSTITLDLEGNFLGPMLFKEQVDRLSSLTLVEFFLNRNGLRFIQDGSFTGLSNLIELDISENKLSEFSNNTLVGLNSLRYMFANNMGLTFIPPAMFEKVPELLYLDLEGNDLAKIGKEFSFLTNLQTLLLANNQITEISPDSFAGLSLLMRTSLFGNELSLPQAAWFSGIISRNGTVELNSRLGSPESMGDTWICCSDVFDYSQYLKSLSPKLISYDQLNIVCSWPPSLSGRVLNNVNVSELNAVNCAEYKQTSTLATTTSTNSNVSTSTQLIAKVAKKGHEEESKFNSYLQEKPLTSTLSPSTVIIIGNFMKKLSDGGAIITLLLVAFLSGALVAVVCYFCRNKKGRSSFSNLFCLHDTDMVDEFNKPKNTTQLTTRPYRQQSPMYGATVDVVGRGIGEAEKPQGAESASRRGKATEDVYTSIVRPADSAYSNYRMETDQSEDEIWSKCERKSPV